LSSSRSFAGKDVSIEALIDGSGPLVVMIASLGRGAEDFHDLAVQLANAGYTVVRAQPRGIGRSHGRMVGLSLEELASDVAMVVEGLRAGAAVLVGHAFGQRVARMLAMLRPDLVKGLVMLAAGGNVPVPPRARESLSSCFDLTLSSAAHMEHVRYAFFAPGNDPLVWRTGWYPHVARMQITATHGLGSQSVATDSSETTPMLGAEAWQAGGSVPILIIQGLQDAIALPENGRLLKAEFPDRVELIEIFGAGHALLPEAPQAVAEAVYAFLKRCRGGQGSSGGASNKPVAHNSSASPFTAACGPFRPFVRSGRTAVFGGIAYAPRTSRKRCL
jgi:pimeloyl-ACP methyl ester carboxylesterase